jgi:hypothetical protein
MVARLDIPRGAAAYRRETAQELTALVMALVIRNHVHRPAGNAVIS